ncbi:hypothetical protein Tco_1114251 [Tanacetum coccineum]|uniref:Uncharacterized protein n=1 Tax=Tanacetum coccineum TaxID=301880 RepID=A0ABQ5IX53_9ASTR
MACDDKTTALGEIEYVYYGFGKECCSLYKGLAFSERDSSLDAFWRDRVWKSVRYGVSKELDTAYWGFLGVGTTFDIFQNIIFISYLEYVVLSLSGYGVLSFILCGLCAIKIKIDSVQTINTRYGMERIRRIDVWEDRLGGIMGLAAVGPAVLWRCWPRQSSIWYAYGMSQVSSLRKSHCMPGMSAH